ncbi:MAG: hypothetical protein H6721_20440 [Sandaracinus sp.]|nr:hypothetical protein [Sandaracinus sp.]MCB9616152.1 hypothetical protein [Sandaracinus sp.]MCB9634499.1 hypothetical protein [Sandaracinus sp.]
MNANASSDRRSAGGTRTRRRRDECTGRVPLAPAGDRRAWEPRRDSPCAHDRPAAPSRGSRPRAVGRRAPPRLARSSRGGSGPPC